jgi:hypothetical protein
MSIVIDGSPVVKGDTLYSRRAGAAGTVFKVLNSAVILRVQRGDSYRDFTVTGNGYIAGEKDVSWFPSIEIPLKKGEADKWAQIQAVLTTLYKVL